MGTETTYEICKQSWFVLMDGVATLTLSEDAS